MINWVTRNNKVHKVNISKKLINCMQEKGARFCKFKDNVGINERNRDFYEDDKAQDDKAQDNKHRVFKENITVVCEDGENITGYIIHIVNGGCHGTDESNWLLFNRGIILSNHIINNEYRYKLIRFFLYLIIQ